MKEELHCTCCGELHVCAEIVPIFNHLDRESLVKISSITVHQHYKKGDIVLSPVHAERLLIVASGRVKVYQLSATNKEQLLRVLEPGNFIGEEKLFRQEGSNLWGEALTDVELCTIGRKKFISLLEQYPSISLKLLEEYSRRLSAVERMVTRAATEPVMTRLTSYLLELSKAQETNCLRLPLSMKELAAFLGTTPETLSRRIHQLEAEQVLRKAGKQIELTNSKILEKYADGDIL